jgi:hypothetical protein
VLPPLPDEALLAPLFPPPDEVLLAPLLPPPLDEVLLAPLLPPPLDEALLAPLLPPPLDEALLAPLLPPLPASSVTLASLAIDPADASMARAPGPTPDPLEPTGPDDASWANEP